MSLVALQQEAVDAILAAREQGNRAAAFGMTCLNRSPRVLRGIRHEFERAATRLGFTVEQIEQQWSDIKDMAKLEYNAVQLDEVLA